MGHSDAFTAREADSGAACNEKPEGVQVWGDPSSFALPPGGAEEPPAAAPAAGGGGESNDLYHRIGHLTRTLHDALRELGYHDSLAESREQLPDARDRLSYIARLTGDAAEKVLNSVDRAREVQEAMTEHAKTLRRRWEAVATYTAGGPRATPAGKSLIDETCSFLGSIDSQAGQTNAILTDIMMAQDFHDLTGQVIRRVISLSQNLEEQLVSLLIDATPEMQRRKIKASEASGLEGPVVNTEGRTDVVTDQAGVDDLLASLGF